MDTEQFSQRLDTIYQRANQFYQLVNAATRQQQSVAVELEELGVALEELQVAEAELLQQTQELEVARAAVEVERRRYYELFELAPDAYLVTDKYGKIQEANRVAANLLNISQKFLNGKLLTNFIAEADRQLFRHKLNQVSQEVTAEIPVLQQEWEIRICPRHTTEVDVAVTVSAVLGKASQFPHLRWLLRDITARKQAEATIRQVQMQNVQLQEATRLKSQFLAIMSHELRSPMNAIIGFSQLLLRPTPNLLASNQAGMVERILKSGMHLLKLIDDILDFSKIEAGRLEFKPEQLNLAELVTATIEEMRPLIEQKHLCLQVEINLADAYIVNDGGRLRQILVNLISNATKFTDSGSIRIEVQELSPECLAIAITDTGIGIAEADIPLLFQEFRQVNQTITRQHSGTGLGLAITERLVRMMRGKIVVESALGQGSTFRVELPRQIETSN